MRDTLLEGKWQLEDKLGQGGMGTVYRARDVILDRSVAIKMLTSRHSEEKEVLARFEREARMMAKLEHPNLVPIYAVGNHEGTPFIVMKYLEGATLVDFLRAKGRPLAVDEVLPLLRQICAALGFIHGKGVVHRDIKPPNIFVSPEGHLTLLDLGVVRTQNEQGFTRSGAVVGTPAYMSPEQVIGDKDVDSRSDLYALGIIVYEMLAGRPPFTGDSEFAVMIAHRDRPPPDLTALAPKVPPGVARVVHKMLEKAKEARFPTATQLLATFEAAAAEAETEPSLLRAVARTPSTVNERGLAARRRQTWKEGLLVAVGIASVAGALWLVTRPSSRHPPPETPEVPVAVETKSPTPPAPPAPPTPAPIPAPAAAPAPAVATPAPEPKPRSPEPKPETHAPHPAVAQHAEPPPATTGQLSVVAVTTSGGMSWAWLDVDGRRVGQTPMSLSLSPGSHQVRLQRTGFKTVDREIRVKPGSKEQLRVELAQ